MGKPKIKRKDLLGAKKRGLLDKEQVDRVRPQRHYRTCVACGRQFLPFEEFRRELYGCGCCALLGDPEKLDRRIFPGVRVVFLATGEAGLVVKVRMENGTPVAVMRMERGGEIDVLAHDIERVHRLAVQHCNGCRHGKIKTQLAESEKAEEET